MKKHPLWPVLIGAALWLTPGQAIAQRHDLGLTERWRTKGWGRLQFASVAGVVETAGGDIWISDPLNQAVASVDAQGRHVRWAARLGDGPGEVRSPALATPVPSGGFAIYDQDRQSVDFFGDDRRFVRRVPIPVLVMNPKGFAVLPNGEILLSGGRLTGPGAVHRFAPDGRLIGSWGETAQAHNPRAVQLLSGGPIAVLPGGLVLYSQAAPHRIALYSASGQQRKLIAAQPNLIPPIGDDFVQERAGRHVYLWNFAQSAGAFRLPDGNLLNVVWNQEANTSTWEVYRPSGGLIVRKRFARAYRPWALARNGDVLATVLDSDTGEVIVVRLALRVT